MKPYDFYITPEEYKRAAENGICKHTLENRIRVYGWDKEKALKEPVKKYGIYPKEIIDIAKSNGISSNTFRKRVTSYGWSIYKAATVPVRSNEEFKKVGEQNRIYPKEIIKKAESNGIKYNTFIFRVKASKWNVKDACTRPLITSKEKGLMGKEKSKKIIEWIFKKRK